jgi:drug/metabolite transporter (DMT)-like permease
VEKLATLSASARPLASRLGVGRADLGMLSVALTWGVNYYVIKTVLPSVDPLVFNATRMVLGAVALLVVALCFGADLRISRRDLPALLGLGILGNTGYQIFFILGIARTTAGNAALMNSTSPVLVALLGTALGLERLGKRGWLGVFTCFIGIALLITGGSAQIGFGGSSTLGDFLVLGGATCWALYTLGSKKPIARLGATKVTVYSLILGIWPLILVAVPRVPTQNWSTVGWQAGAAVAFSGLFAIAYGYILWSLGIKHLGPARTAVYSTLPPVVTAVLGWLLLGEQFSGQQWIGAAMTLMGVILTRLPSGPGPNTRHGVD